MLPFQTDTFDPSDAQLLQLVQAGERLTWLYLGATVYLVDIERWVVVGGYDYRPQGPCSLAYPLPFSYGVDDIPAVKSFEEVLRSEFNRLAALDPMPALETIQAPAPEVRAPVAQHPRPPKGRPITLAGAVPLPGLEPWSAYGCLG